MEKYRFFRHTADAKFQAFGPTLEETFANAALAVVSLMWDREKIARRIEIPVTKEGRDLEQLLVGFLEEILYLLDTRNFVLGSAQDISLEKKDGDWTLHSLFIGDWQTEGYEIFGNVKAITYNEIVISDRPPFMVQVVVDI